jgi:hypothetical protein
MSTPPDSSAQSVPSISRDDSPEAPLRKETGGADANVRETAKGTFPGDARSSECPICEAERQGAYCVDCGHAFQDERLRLRPLIQRGISRVFDLDHGLLHTFLELFRRPGAVAKDYATGIRHPYVNPFTYFVLAAAVQVVAQTLMRGPMSTFMRGIVAEVPQEQNIFYYMLGDNWVQEYVELLLNFTTQAYTWMAFVFFAIPFAVALRFFMGKRRINLAEGLVFSLYVSAQMLLITAVIALVAVISNSIWLQQALVYPAMFIWAIYAMFSYFGRSVKTFVTGGVAVILTFMCFASSLAVGMLTYVVTTVGTDRIAAALQQMASAQ